MKLFKCVSLALTLTLIVAPLLASETRGTCEEAKALVEKGAAFLKAEGPSKALSKFSDKKGGFVDRDLYVFVVDNKGVIRAHAMNPAVVDKDGLSLKDPTGWSFIRDFINVKNTAWVDYKWMDPIDGKIKAKKSYIIRVGDFLLGTGCYKE
jgi:cytochrome c